MLKYAYYNWRVAIFRSRVIEMMTLKAPPHSIEVRYVDPRGTPDSAGHDEAMRRYGLDRHTAPAYTIAIKGLKQ